MESGGIELRGEAGHSNNYGMAFFSHFIQGGVGVTFFVIFLE